MKQFFTLLITFCLAGAHDTSAQSLGGGKIKYGIKAGINMATYGHDSERKSDLKEDGFKKQPLFSFHLGGYADYSITEAFSIQAGLTLSGKGYRESWSGEDESGDFEYEGNYKESLTYLEIPINAVYKTGSFYVGAGPYIAYALSGKWKEKYKEDFGDGDIESDMDSGKILFSGEYAYYKRADFGINILAGYQLNEKISLGANYGLGLSNLDKDRDLENQAYWSFKNRVFSVSVGYSF